MKDQIIQFLRDEEGATAIEYGLIAGLIAVGLIASMGEVRTAIAGFFTKIKGALDGITVTNGAAAPTPPV